MNPGIFTQLLNALQNALAPGLGAMRPYILGLFTFLAFLELTRLAVGWAMGAADLPRSALRFLLRTGVLLWIVLDYPLVTTLVYQSFIQLGLVAGGNALTVPQFLDPGTYVATGFRAGKVLFDAWTANLGWMSFPLAIAYLSAWVCFLLAYGIMALAVFLLQVEFTITIMAAVVMLPFATLHGTGWIAQGALSYPINVGFRFFVLALLASVVFPLLGQITATTASLETALVMIMAAWMMAFLFLKGPAIAAGIVSGMPSLSAGQVVQAAAGTAIAGGATVVAGRAVAGAGLRAISSTGHGLVRGLSAVNTAYEIGSAGTVGGKIAHFGGGMRSVGMASVNTLKSSATAPFKPSIARLKQTTTEGHRAGWVHSGGKLPDPIRSAQEASSRPTPPMRALQEALAKSARYFNDNAHGGTHAHLE